MSKSTRATRMLNKLGVNFTLHSYDYDADAERVGLQAAEALGIQPRRVLKTLMAEVDGKPVCAIVPSDREVSLKKLATAFDGKTAKMMRPADAERLTGYHVGGISPFAQKKRVPIAIDETAMTESSVFLNGGQRGLQIQLEPNDARKALDAIVDILSAGRLRVGFGIGWSPDEYEAAGVTWQERGKRADELIKALKKIWTTDPVGFQGKYYRIPQSFIGPKPVQRPHPPIYMAAFTPSALKRVATEANGWFPVGIPLSGIGPMFDGIKDMAKDAGRDPSALELILRANVEIHNIPIENDRGDFTGTLEQIAEDIKAAQKLGAAEVVLDVQFSPGVETAGDIVARMEQLWRVAKQA